MPSITSDLGSGKPLRSASAIVASTESGQHLLKIAGYSRTKDVPTGSSISSRPFSVGGHSWHIDYYPNGQNSTCVEFISVVLQLQDYVPLGVRAQYGFSLLDHRGKPVPQYTRGDKMQMFHHLTWWGYLRFIKREDLEKSDYLRDDSFTIRLDFTVTKEIETKDIDVDSGATPPPPAVAVPPSDLHHHLGGLLVTREAADVMFEVDGKAFPAHRLLLTPRSPVLHAQLSAMESTVLRIKDMEAQDFEAFLHYIYTDTLPEMDGDAAVMLPDLVAAANRYKMERLRMVCEDKLCEFVNARTVAAMLTFAGEQQCHGLKEACLQFLEDPANVKEAVKVNNGLEHLSPSALKDLIAKLVAGLQLSNAR